MKIAILGAGNLGISVMESLLDTDFEISLVDKNEAVLEALSQKYDILTFTGNARTTNILKEMGIDTYDYLLSCTTDDDLNIIAASNAKALGCGKVLAVLREPEYLEQDEFMHNNYNIDAVINPDLLISNRICSYLFERFNTELSSPSPVSHISNRHSVMILGGGHTGFYLTKQLSDNGIDAKVIEIDEERCQYLSETFDNAIILNGNCTDLSLLEEENFDEMDALMAVTGSDEVNLLLSVTAKNHGIEHVFTRIRYKSYDKMASQLGIDMVLNLMDISTKAILNYINE